MQDLLAFDALPQKAKDQIRTLRPIFTELLAFTGKGIAEQFGTLATAHNLTESFVRTTFYKVQKAGWRGLINGRFLGKGFVSLSAEFRAYWHGLVFEYQRNSKKAFDHFHGAYVRGELIPGLPAAALRTAKLPRALSLRNLRRHMPTKAAQVLARQGFAAAKHLIATGPQDLSHIRPLEFVLFDDVELDFLIAVPGESRAVKLRLIVAMDLCSRMVLGYGVRPAVVREDGKEDGLKLRDMKAVVCRLLRTWGVPMEYDMHLICERGTAALPDAVKAALAEMSDGRIIVHDTGMIVGQVFEWGDKATGNSWGKAWLESSFNLLHNELQMLPGQKGRRYDLAPAELHGRRGALAVIERVFEKLPGAHFRRPFLNIAEALAELDEAFARIHARRDHRLNSFEDVAMWALTPDDAARPAWELPENLRPVAASLIWTSEKESPLWRFKRNLPAVESRLAIPDSALQRLMDEQKRVPFVGMAFAFTHERTDYVYLPAETMLPHLREGEHFILWFHPQDMSHVFVTRDRPHLGYVGIMKKFTAGKRGDLDDAKEYLRTQKARMGAVVREVQNVSTDRLRLAGDMIAHNVTEARGQLDKIAALEMEIDVCTPQTAARGTVSTRTVGAMRTGKAQAREAEENAQLGNDALASAAARALRLADPED